MSAALVRKELRDQLHFLMLGALLCLLEVLHLASGQPDLQPLSESIDSFTGISALFQLVLGFAAGAGLLVREEDEGTLRFLDGLPVTRVRLFATKLLVALGVLLVYPTVQALLHPARHALSASSLTPELHPELVAIGWGLSALATLVGLALGMALGFLRGLAWAAFGLAAILVRLSGELWPRLQALDPTRLLDTSLAGTRWHLSGEALAVQLGGALALLALSLAAFTSGRGRSLARLGLELRRPVVSAVVAAATIGALLGTVALFEDPPERERGEQGTLSEVAFPEAPPGQLETRRYRLLHPGFAAEPARALAARADEAWALAARKLATGKEDDARIDVDLSGSMRNTLGTAHHERIRLRPDAEAPLFVLAHETAHVLARRLTLERGDELLRLMPVLSEGLAQWVAYDAEGGAEQRRSDERAAAALHARGEVSFAQLADFAAFARDRDQDLIYPLGGALVRALEGRYGPGAVHRVLATLAREDFPSDRRGVPLWQTAFQLAGFDLSRVLDDFFGLLAAWGEEHREELEALPRLRALVRPTDEGAEIEIRAEPPLPAGARLVVRTRPGADSDRSLTRTHPAPEGKAHLPRRLIAHGTVCLQPGLVLDGVVLYEAWRCVPLE